MRVERAGRARRRGLWRAGMGPARGEGGGRERSGARRTNSRLAKLEAVPLISPPAGTSAGPGPRRHAGHPCPFALAAVLFCSIVPAAGRALGAGVSASRLYGDSGVWTDFSPKWPRVFSGCVEANAAVRSRVRCGCFQYGRRQPFPGLRRGQCARFECARRGGDSQRLSRSRKILARIDTLLWRR